MPSSRCVVQGCSNTSNPKAGISLHNSPVIPSFRAQWKRFVSAHRANFDPPGRFVVCSEHFTEDCFTRTIHVGGSMKRLQPFSVPTIWKKKDKEPTSSSRDRRMIINELLSSTSEIDQPMETDESSSSQLCQPGPSAQPETLAEAEPVQVEADPSDVHVTVPNMEFQLHDEDVTVEEPGASQQFLSTPSMKEANLECSSHQGVGDASEPTADPKLPKKCPSCKVLKDEVASLKGKVTRLQKQISTNQEQWVETFREIHQQKQLLMVNAETQTPDDIPPSQNSEKASKNVNENEIDETQELPDDFLFPEQQDGKESYDEDPTWTPEEIDRAYETLKEDDDSVQANANPKLDIDGKDIREEPKGIVFLSKLLILFQFCHLCFFPKPECSVTQTGTMLTIETKCSNCKQVFTWKSQPFLLGKFPAGNLLLSLAVLCAGASVKKVLLVFKHMGTLVYHEPTFYYHQRHLLIPTIVMCWHKYQKKVLDALKGKGVVLAGDGRHDSMGHSAKFATYSIFCCTVGLIVHIVLVQANQAGSSSAMEFMAFQKAFTYLLGTGVIIKAFISDRHTSIAKWMREECPKKCKDLDKPVIDHFFDLWHIAKNYVADIYNTLMTTPREELKALENELKQEVPAPLHSMLEKENKDEAILKHQARKQKETVICPPTCTEEELQQELARSQPPMSTDERTASGRRVPHCRTCGKPTRGHGPQCQNNDSA